MSGVPSLASAGMSFTAYAFIFSHSSLAVIFFLLMAYNFYDKSIPTEGISWKRLTLHNFSQYFWHFPGMVLFSSWRECASTLGILFSKLVYVDLWNRWCVPKHLQVQLLKMTLPQVAILAGIIATLTIHTPLQLSAIL